MQADPEVIERASERGFTHRPALDGIRAISVTAVFVYHVSLTGREHGGFLGVSTFFTLSGFLITSLLIDERERQGRIDLSGFALRRLRRLLPAAYLNLGLVLLLSIAFPSAWPRSGLFGDVASVIGNVANWRFHAVGADTPLRLVAPLVPQWSLAVEEQFYLVMPFVIAGALALGATRRSLAALFAIIGTASIAIAWFVSYDSATELAASTASRELLRTDVRLVELLAGALMAALLPGWRLASTRVAALFGGFGAGLTAYLWLTAHSEDPWLRQGGLAIVALASCGLIVGALGEGPVEWLLSRKPLVALGRISYGVYLFHWPIYLVVRPENRSWGEPVGVFVVAALTVALATASNVLVETPIRNRRVGSARIDALVLAGSVAALLAGAWAVGT